MFYTQIKKYIAITVVTLFLFVKIAVPASFVFAEEVSPTPQETQTQETQQITTQEENQEVTPTPIPTVDPTNIETSNSAELTNNIESESNTRDNLATQSATPTLTPTLLATPTATEDIIDTSQHSPSSPDTSITTGDAVSVTEIENILNTTSVGSTFVHHTINLFVNENGDIDLSDPFEIAQNIIVEEENLNPVVNVLATDSENYAYLSNDAVSKADTGSNSIQGEGTTEAVVNTGNAYSIMSLLNQVNFTIVGSTIHIVTINIFGNLTGNIILPEFESLGACTTCGMSVATENEAVVTNNVSSGANSGENQVEFVEEGTIETGHAESVVGLTNMINTNVIGMLLWNLTINVFGEWNGDFLGWSDILGAISGGNGLSLSHVTPTDPGGCSGCTGDVSIYNSAYVENNVDSSANTGNNTVQATNGLIHTGNAYSAVTLSNFVNSNFINSTAFFGFINIFGQWNGNIGGESKFTLDEPIEETDSEVSVASTEEVVRENGGQLSVININNVGTHVNPGDTVTFFLDVSNPGVGKVYDTKLSLYLVNAYGENVGGTVFDLKEIGAGKKVKVSTGFVLSDTAEGGYYTAVAVAKGVTGPQNTTVEGEGFSEFLISGGSVAQIIPTANASEISEEKPSVLGLNTNDETGKNRDTLLLYLLFGLVITYLSIRVAKKREHLSLLFVSDSTFRKRLYSLKLFLL